MNSDKIIKEFGLKRFGSKGWMQGDLHCPECGRSDKFATLFTETGAVCHCFRCSLKVPLFRVLIGIGRKDLIDFDTSFTPTDNLSPLKQTVDSVAIHKDFIFKFERIQYDDYLNSRGFTKLQYDKFNVGQSLYDTRVLGKLVFLIYQHGELVAWLARSRKSKEWHKENIRLHKLGLVDIDLRYRNSNSDFSKILGGLDEITTLTETVILVEGIMDKANIDRLMLLDDSESIKCCFTFGGDISIEQCDLIPNTVENVILMYDPDALKNMKESGGRLINRFTVECAIIEDKNIDPGNITAKYLSRVLSERINYLEFFNSLIGELR